MESKKALKIILENTDSKDEKVVKEAISVIKLELELADIFRRFLVDDEVWKDLSFGVDNDLYIDGLIKYKNDKERKDLLKCTAKKI